MVDAIREVDVAVCEAEGVKCSEPNPVPATCALNA